MAYDFPANPSVNQQFTPVGGPTWRFNGSTWMLLGGAEPGGGGTGELTLVSAIDPPPDPSIDGTLWYDPSSGDIFVWYNGSWYPEGTPAPSSPTPVEGQEATVSVGPVAVLVKELDLPVPYFDGGNSYYTQFYYANLAGWSSPDFFPFGVFLSPSYSYYGPNTAEAGITHYIALEGQDGAIVAAIENNLGMILQNHREWTMDRIDAENGDDNPLCLGWLQHDEPDLFGTLSDLIAEKAVYNSYDGGRRFTFVNVSHGLTGDPLFQPAATPAMVRVGDVGCADEYFYSGRGIRELVMASPNWPKDDTDPEELRRAACYGWIASRLKTCQDPENPKPYWTFVETGRPLLGVSFSGYPFIINPEISGAAWSIIRNEARGVAFFQHSDQGYFYSIAEEGASVVRGHLTALTAEITGFAPVIDGPTYEWDFGDENIETLLKAHQGYGYIFAGPSIYAPFPGRGLSDITLLSEELMEFQFTSTAETGTVSSTITVPDYTELVVVMVSGLHGTNSGFASMTFTKGGIDTAMSKATGGDSSGASWQSAVFYLGLPDVGTNKSLKWDWLGAASDGPRTIAVTFWQGVDLNNPVRDSTGLQTTGMALETPILVETSVLEVANGDKILSFCGMYNPTEDGGAAINVWHQSMVALVDLTAQDYAQGAIGVSNPDGDCTTGFTNISKATEAAFVSIVMKKATLEAVTSSIETIGDLFVTTGGTSNSGIFFGAIDVPADCEFVLAGVLGAAAAESLTSISMLKGGIQTPFVRLECADAIAGWQAALFYMIEPDTGPSNVANWNWVGSDPIATGTELSMLFLKGVDLADPVRQSGATQSLTVPVRTPVLSNREGDLVVTYVGMYTGGLNGSIDTWLNATLFESPDNNGFLDCAWATTSVIGSVKIGAETATNYGAGGICAVALKPAAAVTPITPAADPPTTPRSVVTGTFTLPPDLEAATEVEVVNEARTIPIVAGVFEDDFQEEYSYHNYKILIGEPEEEEPPPPPPGGLSLPLIPWHGGPTYWAQFDKAHAAGWSDPDFFPFGLFLSPPQEGHPANAAAAGVTHYMSIEGILPLSDLTDDGIHAWPHTGEWAPNGEDSRLDANSETDPLVVAWFTSDEIDMIGGDEFDILALSQDQVAEARGWDDGTFVGLNIGNGVNRTWWCPLTVDDIVQDVDIACCDQYAYTSADVRENMAFSDFWPSGVSEAAAQCAGAYGWLADQMYDLQDPDGRRPYGVTVETAMPYLFPYPSVDFRTITIPEIGGAVWASIIHGASMIMFFQHNNDPAIDNYSVTGTGGGTTAIRAGLAAITAEVRSVASIINTQSYEFAFGASGIDTMLKAVDGFAYIFAGVGLGGSPGAKTFTVTGTGISGTDVEVVGESRSLTISGGIFSDSFAAEYTHHIYKIEITP